MASMTTKISVKVQPNAGRNEIVGLVEGVWKVKIGAPPDKGKANKELLDFLSEVLDIRKDSLSLVRGQTSHNKVVEVEGLTAGDAFTRLKGSLRTFPN
jgi:uncharacterized protein (TIGR00251 family)